MNAVQIITFTGFSLVCFAYAVLIGLITIAWFRLPLFISSRRSLSTLVTIIIAARNEETNLGACLDAIAAQDYPRQLYEVIVVDDHSTDGTHDLVSKIISDDPLRKLTLLTPATGMQGKKACVSQAIKHASGEWIVTTDADCTMDKQWLTTLMQCTGEGRLQMLLAPVVYGREKSVFGQMQELEFMSLMASAAGAAAMGMPIMCNGANLAYRKTAFLEINGYADNQNFASGDDMFLMMKIRKTFGSSAIRFVKSPLAIVTTKAASSFSVFVNQRMRWVSKSRGYRDAGVLIASLVVYAFSLCTLIALVAWAFGYTGLMVPVICLVLKLMVDLPLMASWGRFTNRSRLLRWYVPLQLIYSVYVTLTGALGNVLPYQWKGRKLR